MKVISSWSGGKDSCLACYKAVLKKHKVNFILNFISQQYKRGCFHGTSKDLMYAQSDAIDIPIVQRETPADMSGYENEFKSAVRELKNKHGIQGMVFGDAYLEEHKSWVERVCKDLDITPIEPLWNIPPEDVVKEFIGYGFKAIVVSAKADLFTEDFIGKEVNYDFIEELKKRNICPCGESGEFHTFVYDGPIFKKRINITKTDRILKEGFWKHWFLDIKKYEVNMK